MKRISSLIISVLLAIGVMMAPAWASISGGGGTTITIISTTSASALDHSLLPNLSYGTSGHTGFVGTGANNTMTGNNIFSGTVAVGTTAATSSLTVYNTIESKVGGIKFPDGTTMRTAATVNSVTAGAGLTGSVTTTGLISIDALGVTNAMLAANAVTSAKISSGTIVNANISDSAAIAYTKINFWGLAVPYSMLTLASSVKGSDLAPGINISTTGNVTAAAYSGTWEGYNIRATKGGTGTGTYAKGDILYASATNVLSKLPVSSDGKVLKLSGGVPVWGTVSGSGSGSGTVSRVSAGSGLMGGDITTAGTLSVVSAPYADLAGVSSSAAVADYAILAGVASSCLGNVTSAETAASLQTDIGAIYVDVIKHVVTSEEAGSGGFYVPFSKTDNGLITSIAGCIYKPNSMSTEPIDPASYLINYEHSRSGSEIQVAGGVTSGEAFSIEIHYQKP